MNTPLAQKWNIKFKSGCPFTTNRRFYKASLCSIVLCFWFFTTCLAQPVPVEQLAGDVHLFKSGVKALEAGHYNEAVKALMAVVNAKPDFYQPGMGSAAYWAGRAFVAAGRPEQARMVWLLGQNMLEKTGHIDPYLSDAYIESVFREQRVSDYANAAAVYLHLLEKATEINDPEEQCVVKKHLAQARPLLAKSDQVRLSESKNAVRCEAWQPTEEAGKLLAAWWRSQDPRLATEHNERLEAHLKRVAEAQQNYVHDWRMSGLDDRGEIYVRYGKPSRQVSIRSGADRLGPGEAIVFQEAGLPKGELWFYDHIDSQGYYFFVQEGRYFNIGQVSDMAYNYRGPGGESKRYALLYQHYEELAFMHPDFAARYTEMENLSNQVNPGSLGQTMRSLWFSTRATEDLEAYEREKAMPEYYDKTLSNTGSLPVAMRSARFLDENGTTRTEIYWHADLELPMQGKLVAALASQAHQVPPGAPLLNLTVAQQDARYRSRAIQTQQHLAENDGKRAHTLPVLTNVVVGDTGLYHIALQWEQYTVEAPGSNNDVVKGAHLRTATRRIDSLMALSNDEDKLEMSDVVPVTAEALLSSSFFEDERPQIQPYPYSTLSEQDSVGLYFEIYHLNFGPDDQTSYSVEYEVIRQKARMGLLPFRKQEVRTATQTSYTGNARTAHDAILLTLEEWIDGELEVVVRVTDEITGQQVERSLRFETTKSR